MADERVTIAHPTFGTKSIPATELQAEEGKGWHVETPQEEEARYYKEKYGNRPGAAAVQGLARGATLGGIDVVGRLTGEEEALRETQRQHPTISGVSEVAGAIGSAVTGIGPAGALSRAGTATAKKLGGKALGMAAAGAVEGVGYGVGAAASEVALDERPVSIERFAAALPSKVVLGGLTGAGAGLGGYALGKAARAAKDAAGKMAASAVSKVDDAAQRFDDIEAIVASGDRKALRAGRAAEERGLKERLVKDLDALRQEEKSSAWYVFSKSDEGKAVGAKGGRAMDRLLDTPISLADRPQRALGALERQAKSLRKFLEKADDLRANHTPGGATHKALDSAESLLSKNQAMIERLRAPSSARLSAFDDAIDSLSGPQKRSAAEGFVGGVVKGGVFAAAMPVLSPLGPLAPILAAKAADLVGNLSLKALPGQLSRAAGAVSEKTAAAVDKFMDVAQRAQRAAPIAATKVLSSTTFAPPAAVKASMQRPSAPSSDPQLNAFREREKEIRAQTTMGPAGKPIVHLEAKKQIRESLTGIRALSQAVGEGIENVKVRGLEFLAEKLPKRPSYLEMITGPERWRPSSFQIASFARYMVAVEDPASVVERLADGSITPEDAEALKVVYPEMYQEIQTDILMRLPELQKTLPYERRLALSIFSGIPVDPAMNKNVVEMLQSIYANEPGTEGGTQPPKPNPQFGSVRNEEPTRAQELAAGQ